MSRKKTGYPVKREMNLFYKPDKTTKPATAALYVLFVLVLILGLSKITVYDLWVETNQAEQQRDLAAQRLAAVVAELEGYDEVLDQYYQYAATEEEQANIDRMEVLALLDKAMGRTGEMASISISGDVVQLQFSGVTLAETAQIVKRLEESDLVAGTPVNTAATTESEGALVQANVRIQLQRKTPEGEEGDAQ